MRLASSHLQSHVRLAEMENNDLTGQLLTRELLANLREQSSCSDIFVQRHRTKLLDIRVQARHPHPLAIYFEFDFLRGQPSKMRRNRERRRDGFSSSAPRRSPLALVTWTLIVVAHAIFLS